MEKANQASAPAASGGTPTVLLGGKNIYADQTMTPAKLKQMVEGGRPRVSVSHAPRYGPVAGLLAVPTARHGSVGPAMNLAYIPSPSHGVLYLAPSSCAATPSASSSASSSPSGSATSAGSPAAGGRALVADIAVWAVPFGLIGGRLYHVITDYELYFSEGRDWVDAFKVWEGGLGIWGAIALGALGAWIGARRRGVPMPAYADAVAPGIAFAQAIGRWGNWFNQELYGRETDLPWALHITSSEGGRVPGYYHPTFLYESLWCVGVGLLVIWADRRFKLGAWPGVRPVRRRVLRGPRLDRVHAGGRRPPPPGPPASTTGPR